MSRHPDQPELRNRQACRYVESSQPGRQSHPRAIPIALGCGRPSRWLRCAALHVTSVRSDLGRAEPAGLQQKRRARGSHGTNGMECYLCARCRWIGLGMAWHGMAWRQNCTWYVVRGTAAGLRWALQRPRPAACGWWPCRTGCGPSTAPREAIFGRVLFAHRSASKEYLVVVPRRSTS